MLTGMKKRMYDAQKHKAKITTQDRNVFVGLCKYFISALDNDSKKVCLTMESPTKNGETFMGKYVDFDLHVIKDIELLD